MAVGSLHIGDGPTGDLDGKLEAFRILTGKGGERFDGLGGTLAVHGVTPVMIVLRAAVGLEEVCFVKFQAGNEVRAPGTILRGLKAGLEAVKIVASVKVVNPVVLWILAIRPGAIGKLARATIFHGGAGDLDVVAVPSMLRGARQHGGPQHVGIVRSEE